MNPTDAVLDLPAGQSQIELLLRPETEYVANLINTAFSHAPMSDMLKAVHLMEAFRLDSDTARAALFPFLFSPDPQDQLWSDYALSRPEARHPTSVISSDGELIYFGREFKLSSAILPNTSSSPAATAEELIVGYLGIYGQHGEPLGFVDVHPNTALDWQAEGPVPVKLLPPEKLSEQAFSRPNLADPQIIKDFIRDYPELFKADGELAAHIGASSDDIPTQNLSIFNLEGKFVLYQAARNGHQASQGLEVLRRFGLQGSYLLAPIIDHADKFDEITRMILVVENPDALDLKISDAMNWLSHIPNLTPDQLIQLTNHQFLDLKEAQPPSAVISEYLTWNTQIEAFCFQMAATMFPHEDDPRIILDMAHVIQKRSRAMIASLGDFLAQNPEETMIHPDSYRFFQDGIKAHIALINLMAYSDGKDVAEQIHLPPYFFQKYREVYAGTPQGEAILHSILELWQETYIQKQRLGGEAATIPADIKAYWKQHESTLAEGAQTGNTKIEIARKSAILSHLYAGKSPQTLTYYDLGSWDTKRLTQPAIKYLESLGHTVAWNESTQVVAIDVSDVPDMPPNVHWVQQTFIDAARDPLLVGKAKILSSDWSATSDAADLRLQLLNLVAYNRFLSPDGTLLLDTAFPEGHGSYDYTLREFKELFPDAPEGVFNFDYKDTNTKSKKFMLLYFEFLIKGLEDSGFEIQNLPSDPQERKDYLLSVINNQADLVTDIENPYDRPVWLANGKPRITLVAKKVQEALATNNAPLHKLILETFGNGDQTNILEHSEA